MEDYLPYLSRRGGTGRRDGLKIRCPQGRVGSTPSAGRLFQIRAEDIVLFAGCRISLSIAAITNGQDRNS